MTGEEEEDRLVEKARAGDRAALEALLSPWRRPLYGYIYRMVTRREDAEDLLQETMVRAIEQLPSFRGEARFKSWLFGIATHVSLDHLRRKKRWRVETQVEGEARARANPERMAEVAAMMARPDFSFEIREHIAFCFSCLARSLEPEKQAAIFLKEVLGFTAQEGASMLGCSEPQFRHHLSAARASMIEAYEGLCQLIKKTGACWQCRGLRELAPERNQGPDLVRIEVKPGVAVTPETLFEARLDIVRTADLEEGRTRKLHVDFFDAVTRAVESQPA
jgi:RNA polymerase sigma-70 factor, ECF subfamily